jgi:hypothetical protein
MKKTILFFAFALMTMTGIFAQKQTGGEKNLEVAFAPLGGNPVSMSGIRLRLFNSEASAIRIGLFLGGSTTKDVTAQAEESNLVIQISQSCTLLTKAWTSVSAQDTRSTLLEQIVCLHT